MLTDSGTAQKEECRIRTGDFDENNSEQTGGRDSYSFREKVANPDVVS